MYGTGLGIGGTTHHDRSCCSVASLFLAHLTPMLTSLLLCPANPAFHSMAAPAATPIAPTEGNDEMDKRASIFLDHHAVVCVDAWNEQLAQVCPAERRQRGMLLVVMPEMLSGEFDICFVDQEHAVEGFESAPNERSLHARNLMAEYNPDTHAVLAVIRKGPFKRGDCSSMEVRLVPLG